MKVPTYKIRNIRTGKTLIVDQAQYHAEHGRFRSMYFGGDWEIVTENHAGGDEGFANSKANHDLVANLKWKREREKVCL